MTNDWTDRLAALRATLPGAETPPAAEETAPAETPATKYNRNLLLTYERKQRGGKPTTIISGFDCSDAELLDIASQIKKRLATGGSARGGEILVQGDRREQLRTLLAGMGYKVKG